MNYWILIMKVCLMKRNIIFINLYLKEETLAKKKVKLNNIQDMILIERINEEEIVIGMVRKNQIIFRKRNLISFNPVFRTSSKEKNSIYQYIHDIKIYTSQGKIFQLPGKEDAVLQLNGKYNIRFAEKCEKIKIFNFNTYDTSLNNLKLYMTEFYPSLGRDFPSVVKVTSDTHVRNLERFFGFFELYSKEIIDCTGIQEGMIVENGIFGIFLFTDIIKCFIQFLLLRKVGGYNIKLHLRSIILSLLYFKRIRMNPIIYDNIEFSIKELQVIQKCLQNKYVFGQSRDDLDDLNKWITLEKFTQVSTDLYLNSEGWKINLSPFSLPSCISELKIKNKQKLYHRWRTQFYKNLSVIKQDALLLGILSCIPPPRTSNIRSMVFYLMNENNDKSYIKHCMIFGVSTVIEIMDVPENLLVLFNKYLSWIFKVHHHEQELETLINLLMNNENPVFFANQSELEILVKYLERSPKLR